MKKTREMCSDEAVELMKKLFGGRAPDYVIARFPNGDCQLIVKKSIEDSIIFGKKPAKKPAKKETK